MLNKDAARKLMKLTYKGRILKCPILKDVSYTNNNSSPTFVGNRTLFLACFVGFSQFHMSII
ncbi:hypothetical protein BTO06_04770 [Tenacibaculum sp. SZ-18]|nr:hypothetical protein BTO06_04770 [Tenacibaculum sp. SZ-18]